MFSASSILLCYDRFCETVYPGENIICLSPCTFIPAFIKRLPSCPYHQNPPTPFPLSCPLQWVTFIQCRFFRLNSYPENIFCHKIHLPHPTTSIQWSNPLPPPSPLPPPPAQPPILNSPHLSVVSFLNVLLNPPHPNGSPQADEWAKAKYFIWKIHFLHTL